MPSIHVPPASGKGTSTRAPDSKTNQTSEVDLALPALDALGEELNRLAAINAELVGQLRGASHTALHLPHAGAQDGELTALRQENADLRLVVEQLEAALASQPNEDTWTERQREYEALLEEKSEVIRTLHHKIQELQEASRRKASLPVPREEELVQLKQELEAQRRQLEEDEESLMKQMREMEMAMSKDRAELARQRQEIQRLQAELHHDVEQASRDNGLQERLSTLRRNQDAPKREAGAEPTADGGPRQGSGLLKRLFG